jgi:hypothetical protein
MEDIITHKRDRLGRWLFVLFLVPVFLAIFFFVAAENMLSAGKPISIPLTGGIICLALSLIFGAICLIRFLRRRSIAGGLFLTTTVATLVYSIASRMLTAGTVANASAPVSAYSTAANGAAEGWLGNITLAHLGLFAVWFLFILFTIYVYVRPIRKIEYLLTQILAGAEIKKMHVGKSVQYKTIEDKLRLLAEDQYQRETQRQSRLAKARERGKAQRRLIAELTAEQKKLPPLVPLETED